MPSVAHSHFVTTLIGGSIGPSVTRPYDALDADRIDFDAWLLPPIDLDRGERLVQLTSRLAGGGAMLAGLAMAIVAIF